MGYNPLDTPNVGSMGGIHDWANSFTRLEGQPANFAGDVYYNSSIDVYNEEGVDVFHAGPDGVSIKQSLELDGSLISTQAVDQFVQPFYYTRSGSISSHSSLFKKLYCWYDDSDSLVTSSSKPSDSKAMQGVFLKYTLENFMPNGPDLSGTLTKNGSKIDPSKVMFWIRLTGRIRADASSVAMLTNGTHSDLSEHCGLQDVTTSYYDYWLDSGGFYYGVQNGFGLTQPSSYYAAFRRSSATGKTSSMFDNSFASVGWGFCDYRSNLFATSSYMSATSDSSVTLTRYETDSKGNYVYDSNSQPISDSKYIPAPDSLEFDYDWTIEISGLALSFEASQAWSGAEAASIPNTTPTTPSNPNEF